MTTADAFLADIVAHPDDDAPRLIYADYLDDQGQPERAEFIRVQCALARWPCECDDVERVYHDECRCKEKAELQRREQGLNAYLSEWSAALPGVLCGGGPNLVVKYGADGRGIDYHFRRGFVERVSCPCAAWLEHGQAVVRQQPVQRVELSDRRPHVMELEGGDVVAWRKQFLNADMPLRHPEYILPS